jgi:hypothetical protein
VEANAFFYVSAAGGDIVLIKGLEPLEGLDGINRCRRGGKQAMQLYNSMTMADVFNP